MVSLIRIISCFVLGFSLISTANAADTRPWAVRTQNTINFLNTIQNPTPSIDLDFETTATTPQGQQVTRYTKRSVPLSKARLGSLAKSATGGPVVLAVSAALIAADYIYNDDTDTWMSPSEKVKPNFPDIPTATSAPTSCNQGIPLGSDKFLYVEPNIYHYRVRYNAANASCPPSMSTGGGWSTAGNCTSGYALCNSSYYPVQFRRTIVISSWENYQPFSDEGIPASDDEIGEAIKNNPNLVTDILNDPISTGTWRDRWPEIEPVATDISDTIGQDVEGIPTENYDPTISDGTTTLPPPDANPSSTSTEWPTFCSWAGVVCDFIDWFKEEPTPPETPEMPTEEIQPVEWDSGLGSGSCPANPVTSFNGETIEYDLTNACWGASTIFKPILLVLSLIGAAYIIVGARS